MLLQEYLNDTHEFASPEQWGVVQSNIPQQWIEQALQMTGVATLRKRRLPMEQALWLVLGVALLSRPLKKCSSNAPGSWISKKRVVQTRLRSECEGHFGLFAGRFARFGRTYPMAHA